MDVFFQLLEEESKILSPGLAFLIADFSSAWL
jgi:hypothetical protein